MRKITLLILCSLFIGMLLTQEVRAEKQIIDLQDKTECDFISFEIGDYCSTQVDINELPLAKEGKDLIKGLNNDNHRQYLNDTLADIREFDVKVIEEKLIVSGYIKEGTSNYWLLEFEDFILDPFFNATWQICRNITFYNTDDTIGREREPVFVNATGLNFTNTSELRVVDTYCNNSGSEIVRDIISNTSDSIYFVLPVNTTNGANTTYSLYYYTAEEVAEPIYPDEVIITNASTSNITGTYKSGYEFGLVMKAGSPNWFKLAGVEIIDDNADSSWGTIGASSSWIFWASDNSMETDDTCTWTYDGYFYGRYDCIAGENSYYERDYDYFPDRVYVETDLTVGAEDYAEFNYFDTTMIGGIRVIDGGANITLTATSYTVVELDEPVAFVNDSSKAVYMFGNDTEQADYVDLRYDAGNERVFLQFGFTPSYLLDNAYQSHHLFYFDDSVGSFQVLVREQRIFENPLQYEIGGEMQNISEGEPPVNITNYTTSYVICVSNTTLFSNETFWENDVLNNTQQYFLCDNGCDNKTMMCRLPEYQENIIIFIIIFLIGVFIWKVVK